MNKRLQNFWEGVGDIFDIFPATDYQQYVPTGDSLERVSNSLSTIVNKITPSITLTTSSQDDGAEGELPVELNPNESERFINVEYRNPAERKRTFRRANYRKVMEEVKKRAEAMEGSDSTRPLGLSMEVLKKTLESVANRDSAITSRESAIKGVKGND